MNRRKIKKKNIAYWILVRFTGDMAVYKLCSNCLNYSSAMYKLENNFHTVIYPQSPYCEWCGKHMLIHPVCRNSNVYIKTKVTIEDVYSGEVTLKDIFEKEKK